VRTESYAIKRLVKLTRGWRYCDPSVAANNKLKPDRVLVSGHDEKFSEALPKFYVRIHCTWTPVGTTWEQAVEKQKEPKARREYKRRTGKRLPGDKEESRRSLSLTSRSPRPAPRSHGYTRLPPRHAP